MPSPQDQEKNAFIASARERAPRADLTPSADGEGFADAAAQAMWLMWGDRAARAVAAPEGFALVPKKPADALLMSMAMRWDHGLGLPGYYDHLSGVPGMPQMPSHAQRLDSALSSMRQLHEEVVGEGFHNPLDESFHQGVLGASRAAAKP